MKKKIAFIILITTVFVATGIMANTYIFKKAANDFIVHSEKAEAPCAEVHKVQGLRIK